MKIQSWIAIILSINLGGCQQFKERKVEYLRWKQDYQASSVIAPLKIPEDLSHPTSTENYILPEQLTASPQGTKISLTPPEFGKID